MKKILILVSILFAVGISNVAASTTTCRTVTELDPYELWHGREVPITKTICHTSEPTPPSAKEYSQSWCNRNYPGSEYRSSTDGCHCPTGDFDYTLRKCVDRNAMCNEKYPGTQYQSDGDRCVCLNKSEEYIESINKCGYPSQYKCKLDDGTMVAIGFITSQGKMCNSDGSLSCKNSGEEYIESINKCGNPSDYKCKLDDLTMVKVGFVTGQGKMCNIDGTFSCPMDSIWDDTTSMCGTISKCGIQSQGINDICNCNVGYEWVDESDKNNLGCKEINLDILTPDLLSIRNYQAMAIKLSSEGIIKPQTSPADFNVSSPILRQELIGIALKLKQIQLPDTYNCKNIFSDVSKTKPNTWVCRAAEVAVDNGIITKENKDFNPENNVSITEGLAMVFNALNIKYSEEYSADNIFYSSIQEWQKPVLAYAKTASIIEDTNINPDRTATRGDIFFAIIRTRVMLWLKEILGE